MESINKISMLHPQISIIRISILFLTAFQFHSCTIDDPVENFPEQYKGTQAQVIFEKDSAFENNLFEEINEHLISINQPPLTINPEANQVAFEHTKHLIETNSLHHQNFSERQNYFYSLGFTAMRENVAMGYDNSYDLIQAWLQSLNHQQAIESNSTHTGISVLKNESGVYFITQIYLK